VQVCHANTFFRKSEADHHTLPPGFTCQEGRSSNKPGLVGLDIGTKTSFGNTQVKVSTHFMSIKWQSGFCSQGVAGAQPTGFEPQRFPSFNQCIPEICRLVWMDKEFKCHLFSSVPRPGDNQFKTTDNRFAELCPL